MNNSDHSWGQPAGEAAPLPRWTPPTGAESSSTVLPPSPARGTGPRRKRSALTSRPAVGAVAGIVGLVLGLGLSAGDTDAAKDDAQAAAKTKIAQFRDQTQQQVEEQVAQQVADAKSTMADGQKAAVDAAVAKAVAEEKSRQTTVVEQAVAEAVRKTKAEAEPAKAVPKAVVEKDPNDPRFGTCGDANAAGYGDYRQGVDAEYDWYQDRDGDGVVCET